MSISHYIQKPQVNATVQWDGTNLADVEAVMAMSPYNVTVTDNGDGTLTLSDLMDDPATVATGQWVVSNASPMAFDTDILAAQNQQVSSPTVVYDVS